MNDIGLWKTKSEKGTEYYKGKIEIDGKQYRVALFTNSKKKTEKSPDMTIKFTEIGKKEESKEEVNEFSAMNIKTEYEMTDKSIEIDDSDLPF